MMYMEAQLSQLTGMVEKALNKKRLGKKQVSEEDCSFMQTIILSTQVRF